MFNSFNNFSHLFETKIIALSDFEELIMEPSQESALIDFPKFSISDRIMFISTSFKIKSNAHVMFCENENFGNSKCYMIIISGIKNTKSIIRKCENGIPPYFLNGCTIATETNHSTVSFFFEKK